MKKLFIVSVEAEILVVAETLEEAKTFAIKEGEFDFDSSDYCAREMTHMPAGWDGDSMPFGFRDDAAPDRDVDGWIEEGAAPTYREMREHLRTRNPRGE